MDQLLGKRLVSVLHRRDLPNVGVGQEDLGRAHLRGWAGQERRGLADCHRPLRGFLLHDDAPALLDDLVDKVLDRLQVVAVPDGGKLLCQLQPRARLLLSDGILEEPLWL